MNVVLDYVLRAVAATLWQLGAFLGPPLLLAAVLHHLSRFARNRFAAAFGGDVYTWLTAPGVAVHELGHVLFCVVFGHRVTKVHLFRPAADGSLGKVEHAWNPRNPWQSAGNFFIGTGPVWGGTALVYALAVLLAGPVGPTGAPPAGDVTAAAREAADSAWRLVAVLLRPEVVSGWRFWAFAYLVFCVGSHITLSRSDLAGAGRGFAWLVGVVFAANLATAWVGDGSVPKTAEAWAVAWAGVVCTAGLIVVAANVVLAVLAGAAATARRG